MNPTSKEHCSSAQICRDRGWSTGTLLHSAVRPPTGNAPDLIVTIEITAVGLLHVLGLVYAIGGARVEGLDESLWDLHLRDWEEA